MQFVATITANIESLTGSPVFYNITSYASGSVVYYSTCEFQDGTNTGSTIYATDLEDGDLSGIYGTQYGSVTVDPSSVNTTEVANPARKYPQNPCFF